MIYLIFRSLQIASCLAMIFGAGMFLDEYKDKKKGKGSEEDYRFAKYILIASSLLFFAFVFIFAHFEPEFKKTVMQEWDLCEIHDVRQNLDDCYVIQTEKRLHYSTPYEDGERKDYVRTIDSYIVEDDSQEPKMYEIKTAPSKNTWLWSESDCRLFSRNKAEYRFVVPVGSVAIDFNDDDR